MPMRDEKGATTNLRVHGVWRAQIIFGIEHFFNGGRLIGIIRLLKLLIFVQIGNMDENNSIIVAFEG